MEGEKLARRPAVSTSVAVATPPVAHDVHIEVAMAVGAVTEVCENHSVVAHVLRPPIIEMARQTEVSTRSTVGKRESVGPFIRRPVTGRTVLAYIMATANGFRIVGHESCGRTLVGIGPTSNGRWTGVTVFTHSRFWKMTEGETGECGECMAADTILVCDMRRGGTIFFMTADAGGRRRCVIEAAHDSIEFRKAVATYAVFLNHMRRQRTILLMTAIARSRLRIMQRCIQSAFE